jgi:acetyl-CoA synthetase
MANDEGSKNEASGVIKSISREGRRFPPSKAFAQRALIKDRAAYEKQYRRSIDDSEAFWDETAKAELAWTKPWDKVLTWNLPWARWFDGGELNLSANCLDRHLATRGDKVALDWEGEPGDSLKLTYRQLHAEVCKAANVLKGLGVVAGDGVAI